MICCKECSCGKTVFYAAPATSPKVEPDRGLESELFNALEAVVPAARGKLRRLVYVVTRIAAAPPDVRLAVLEKAKKAAQL